MYIGSGIHYELEDSRQRKSMNSAMISPGDLEGRQTTARRLTGRDVWWKILRFVLMIASSFCKVCL